MLADLRFTADKLFAVGAAYMGLRCRSIGITLARGHDKNCQQGKDAKDATKDEPPATITPARLSSNGRDDCDAKPNEKKFHNLARFSKLNPVA